MLKQKFFSLRRLTSFLLVLTLLLSAITSGTFAVVKYDTGLCPHHTAHTEECGYNAETGAPCTYDCDICAVQKLINDLPSVEEIEALRPDDSVMGDAAADGPGIEGEETATTPDNGPFWTAIRQTWDAYLAYLELSAAERAEIDGAEIFDDFIGQFSAEIAVIAGAEDIDPEVWEVYLLLLVMPSAEEWEGMLDQESEYYNPSLWRTCRKQLFEAWNAVQALDGNYDPDGAQEDYTGQKRELWSIYNDEAEENDGVDFPDDAQSAGELLTSLYSSVLDTFANYIAEKFQALLDIEFLWELTGDLSTDSENIESWMGDNGYEKWIETDQYQTVREAYLVYLDIENDVYPDDLLEFVKENSLGFDPERKDNRGEYAEYADMIQRLLWLVEYSKSVNLIISVITSVDDFETFLSTFTDSNTYYDYMLYDVTVTLMTDINLAEVDGRYKEGGSWTPIGTKEQPFCITFDGQDHTIYGLSIDKTITSDDGTFYYGLFGYIGVSDTYGCAGAVKDLTVKGTIKIESAAQVYVGGVVGWNDGGTIENCVFGDWTNIRYNQDEWGEDKDVQTDLDYSSSITVSCSKDPEPSTSGLEDGVQSAVGGVVGYNVGSIVHDADTDEDVYHGVLTTCHNDGKVSGTFDGTMKFRNYVDGTPDAGDTISSIYVGGIVGWSTGRVYDCHNDGEVNAKGDHSTLGGIVGNNGGGEVSYCRNQGVVTNLTDNDNKNITDATGAVDAAKIKYTQTGGLAGSNNGSIAYSWNKGTVTGSFGTDSYNELRYNAGIGGIVGYNGSSVGQCFNEGTVEGENIAGGIAGTGGSSQTSLDNCANRGTVKIKRAGGHAGGVAGTTNAGEQNSGLHNCYNYGSVFGGGEEKTVSYEYEPYYTIAVTYNDTAGGVVGVANEGSGISNCWYLLDDGGNTFEITDTFDRDAVEELVDETLRDTIIAKHENDLAAAYKYGGTGSTYSGNGITGATAEQFADGTVAWELIYPAPDVPDRESGENTLIWGQELGTYKTDADGNRVTDQNGNQVMEDPYPRLRFTIACNHHGGGTDVTRSDNEDGGDVDEGEHPIIYRIICLTMSFDLPDSSGWLVDNAWLRWESFDINNDDLGYYDVEYANYKSGKYKLSVPEDPKNAEFYDAQGDMEERPFKEWHWAELKETLQGEAYTQYRYRFGGTEILTSGSDKDLHETPFYDTGYKVLMMEDDIIRGEGDTNDDGVIDAYAAQKHDSGQTTYFVVAYYEPAPKVVFLTENQNGYRDSAGTYYYKEYLERLDWDGDGEIKEETDTYKYDDPTVDEDGNEVPAVDPDSRYYYYDGENLPTVTHPADPGRDSAGWKYFEWRVARLVTANDDNYGALSQITGVRTCKIGDRIYYRYNRQWYTWSEVEFNRKVTEDMMTYFGTKEWTLGQVDNMEKNLAYPDAPVIVKEDTFIVVAYYEQLPELVFLTPDQNPNSNPYTGWQYYERVEFDKNAREDDYTPDVKKFYYKPTNPVPTDEDLEFAGWYYASPDSDGTYQYDQPYSPDTDKGYSCRLSDDGYKELTKGQIIVVVAVYKEKARDVYRLTVKVDDAQKTDSFLYTVKDATGSSILTVSVKGQDATTVRLPAGTYTVTEISDWSWKYGVKSVVGDDSNEWIIDGEKAEITFGDPDNGAKATAADDDIVPVERTVTYSYQSSGKNWLGGESSRDNGFKSNAG